MGNNRKSLIYLIRHGITEGNLKRWFYGAADIPLADEGRKQIADLKSGGFYPVLPPGSLLFSTGMKRAEETLRIICGDVPHIVIPELKEFDFGDFECRPYDEIKDDEDFMRWGMDTIGTVTIRGGESQEVFSERVMHGIEKLLAAHRELEERQFRRGEAAVSFGVCHGGPISSAMQQLFPGERKTMWDWIPDPGSGYMLEVENGRPVNAVLLGSRGRLNNE